MGLLKYVVIGAVAVYSFKYASKKRKIDGKSLLDDLKDGLNDAFCQAKEYKNRLEMDYNQTTKLYWHQ